MLVNLPDTPTLLTRIDRGTLHVSINRPEARNAMNEQVPSRPCAAS